MLFKALVNYVEPKIRLEEGRLEPLQAQRTAAGASGKGVKKLEKEIAQQEEFISELRDFEGKLRRVANLHLPGPQRWRGAQHRSTPRTRAVERSPKILGRIAQRQIRVVLHRQTITAVVLGP